MCSHSERRRVQFWCRHARASHGEKTNGGFQTKDVERNSRVGESNEKGRETGGEKKLKKKRRSNNLCAFLSSEQTKARRRAMS
ncbi:hypothetical protein DY000_02063719, partial [Brassica cretica]